MREVWVLITFVCLCVTTVWTQDPITTPDPTDVPSQERKVIVPPLIVTEPPQRMAFREQESIEMPCRATGEPEPTYYWHFNNEYFDPSGNDGRIAIQPGVGTLIFARPIRRDEGIYQCFARNLGGISASVKVDLRWAFLEPFQSKSIITHRPLVGHPQTLKCVQPRSYPKPEVFWATVAQGETFKPIDLTDRVTIDPETGSLHLANVLQEDGKGGRTYACVVQNKVVRSFQQGDYQIISPQGDMSQTMAPSIMWQSPTHQVALRDDQWRVKCIFSGRPTPRVDWARLDGKNMPDRARQESFGQELVIEKVRMDDAGEYECQGINDATQTPTRRSFSLKVEASPYWKRKPESKNSAEFDKAVFYCEAYGFPEPTYEWFIDGTPVSKISADSRRIVQKNSMTFMNLSREDVQVIQCNATNKHGYIFANAYLNVLTEPPTITEPPLKGQKAAEGQTINLTCTVFGSPKPLVIWRKGSEQLTGGRFKIMEEGHLQITDVSLVDAGTYTCTAQNRLGTMTREGSLIVRRRTQIQTIPLDVTVYEGTEAKFTCTATTDPEEVQNLEIRWKKDGDFIDYRVAQRMFKNIMDNSLSISGTIAQDTAKYTCVAVNGLDSDEASAQLVVQGPPDPPSAVIVEWFEKAKREVRLSWQPSKENYAPILNFVIQFNTTFTPDTWIDLASNVSQNQRQGEFILSPYGNYSFRALARNKVGMSPPSDHTRPAISTEPAPPEKNPENVIGEGDQPNNLIIYWTPMPLLEQNAASFYYLISWKRADINEIEKTHRVDDALQYKFIVPQTTETYRPYEITVKAANAEGDATVQPKMVIGYSGEDTPLDAPTSITVSQESIRDTQADISWSQVDIAPSRVRGFFRGYRISFWKAGESHVREQDVILREPEYYRPPRAKRALPDQVNVRLEHLTPYSEISFYVQVLNKYYVGPSSVVTTFRTKEGKPGPPAQFDVKARGSTHFDLIWTKPREENGILIGYNISYQSITGLNLGRLQYRQPITNPNSTSAQLTGLQPERNYRVFLSAVTAAGQGEPIFLDMRTTVPGPPSKPTFAIMDIWETAVNISWEPARSGNPGSVFYCQYRPRGMYHWENTADESNKFWKYIENLWPGTVYQARVVAKNGAGQESGTEYQDFRTSGVPPGRPIVETSPWFYGMILALFLIIGLLIGFFILKRFTDKQWDTKETEREEQIRTLQAQIATEQMGFVNQYADTGSRTDFMESSYGSELKKPPIDTDYHSDEDVFPNSYPPGEKHYPGYGAQQPMDYPSHSQPGIYAEPPVEDQYAPPPVGAQAGAYGYSPPDQSQLGYRPPAAQSSPQPGVHRPLAGSPATGGLTGAGLAGSPAMMGLPPGVQVQDGQYVMQQPGAPKDAMSTFV